METMSEVATHPAEDRWKIPSHPTSQSLMTPLGLVEGEVLEYLDRHHSATLRRLNRELPAPSYLVIMAVGALIRSGLVRGDQRELEVVVKLRKSLCELGYENQGGMR